MRFDERNMENLSNELMDKIKDMKTQGNPQVNETLYMFQQEILPNVINKSVAEFFINYRKLGDIFIHKLIENLHEIKFNEHYPGSRRDIYCSIEIINSTIELIQININTHQVMLAKRMYIVSDLTYQNVAYFLTENSMGNDLMFCSVNLNHDGSLRRTNYGPVRDSEIAEKNLIIDILSGRKKNMF